MAKTAPHTLQKGKRWVFLTGATVSNRSILLCQRKLYRSVRWIAQDLLPFVRVGLAGTALTKTAVQMAPQEGDQGVWVAPS